MEAERVSLLLIFSVWQLYIAGCDHFLNQQCTSSTENSEPDLLAHPGNLIPQQRANILRNFRASQLNNCLPDRNYSEGNLDFSDWYRGKEHNIRDRPITKPFFRNEHKSISTTSKFSVMETMKARVMLLGNTKLMTVLFINGFMTTAMIDTGSDVNIVRDDLYRQLGSPPAVPCRAELWGVGRVEIIAKAFVYLPITIQDNDYVSRFFILPNNSVPHQMIIGHELLKRTKLCAKQNLIKIKKLPDDFEGVNWYKDVHI